MIFMRDGHIHIDKQPYTLNTIKKMVQEAISKNIDEIWVLDHSHKFLEFSFLYTSLNDDGSLEWFKKKKPIPILDYISFIKRVKEKSWPITIKFGLEVCYLIEHKNQLKKVLNSLPTFDFIVGSVHFVFNTAIDLKKEILEPYNINDLYIEYFKIIESAIQSRLFTSIGHPDLIKYMCPYPDYNLYVSLIDRIAKVFSKHNQLTENNSGLIRYGFPYPGLSNEMLSAFDKYGVRFHKCSDAHSYEDIGRSFEQLASHY